MTEIIGKHVGRVPTYCGDFDPLHGNGDGYDRFNIVSFAECCFISVVENNKNEPCSIVYDSSGFVEEYNLNDGWRFVANTLDSSIWVGKMVEDYEIMQAEISDMDKVVFPLQISFGCVGRDSKTLLEYTGSEESISMSWVLSRKGSEAVPDEIEINSVEQEHVASGSTTMDLNTLGKTEFVLRVLAQGIDSSTSKSITMVLPIYAGFYSLGSTLSEMYGSLTKFVKSSPAGRYTLSNDSESKHFTFCIPSTMSISTIKSSGFDVPMKAVATDDSMTVGGEARAYKIYRSDSAINPGTMVVDIT